MGIDIIISNVVVGLLFGYFVYNMKKIEGKADKAIDEVKARQLIADKIEPLKVTEEDIKADLERLEEKIDKLIDLQLHK